MVGSVEDLWPEERIYIETALASRQIEFATGRVLARRLLRELGHPERPIKRDADRVPVWPAGVLGSISHTEDACLVVLSEDRSLRGIGVDVEVNSPRSIRFLKRITTASERASLGGDAASQRQATSIFSIKEAVFKACFPRLREQWGFRDVEVEIDSATGRFCAKVPASVAGNVEGLLCEEDNRIWTVACWV